VWLFTIARLRVPLTTVISSSIYFLFGSRSERKTYASGLIDLSGDISTVSRLLGHASIDTTAIYDRRGEAAKRKVAEGCHLPYRSQ